MRKIYNLEIKTNFEIAFLRFLEIPNSHTEVLYDIMPKRLCEVSNYKQRKHTIN